MSSLVVKAYLQLILFDFYQAHREFSVLYNRVRNCPVRKAVEPMYTIEQICHAVDVACIWYRKQVLCLQRAAATACLLKNYGVAAEMVIGAQQVPFKAHAWVEVGARVVNDKPYTPEIYAVLDRF